MGTRDGVRADVVGGGTDDLLAACVAVRRDASLGARLTALTDDEWLVLAGRAQRHRVLPLLWQTAREVADASLVPARVATALERGYVKSRVRHERQYGELAAVVGALGEVGVRVVALKGAYLAASVYDDPALRWTTDLDLLARLRDLERCDTAITALGYEREDSDYAHLVGGHHLPAFTHPVWADVEMHWSIGAFGLPWEPEPGRAVFRIDMEDVWARVTDVRIRGLPLAALSPEDTVLHLCVHAGYNHAFNHGVLRLCDIDRLVLRFGERLDWRRLAATAVAWGAGHVVHAVLRLVRDVLGTPLPPEAFPEVGWTAADEASLPTLRTEVLRYPRAGTAEREARRPIIDAWILRATGAPGRGSIVAGPMPATQEMRERYAALYTPTIPIDRTSSTGTYSPAARHGP